MSAVRSGVLRALGVMPPRKAPRRSGGPQLRRRQLLGWACHGSARAKGRMAAAQQRLPPAWRGSVECPSRPAG
eukprot:14187967-Alexandrium_andersonii.AAC.1